jgi:iron(III) transport system ATP-binding protein
MSVLKITNLNKSFGKVCVAKNISLEVQEGEIFTLMGKSGSGKSSLLRMICGFERPDNGEIILGDKTIFAPNIDVEASKRKLAIVFQHYALFPHLSVAKNILFGYEKLGREKLANLMAKTGISNIKDRYPHEISGGQQQRVALCRALIRQPKLLLLDEPFSSVDNEIRMMLRQELKQMIKEFNITSVFVTHDREDAFHISDRLALMADGKILQIGNIKTLYEHPVNQEAAGLLGKINVIYKNGAEFLFRPNDIDVCANGEFEARVFESVYHGFYYINVLKLENQLITTFTPNYLNIGDKVKFNVLRYANL